ncbi:MAG: hypothetical protein ABSC05_22455, partial [Candidatus Solibacter sp.]
PDLEHRDDPSWSSRARSVQIRIPGSLLESTGGSVLESAEGAAESNVILQPRTFGFPASPLSVAAK